MTVLLWGGPLGQPADHRNVTFTKYAGDLHDDSIVHRDDLVRWQAAIAAARRGASPVIDVRLRRVDGEYRWHRVELSVAEARWFAVASAEEPTNLPGITREDEDLVSRVAHELVTPLTTMLLWEGVLREPLDERLQAQAIAAIRQSALEQSRLVGELLDMSRALKGTLHLAPRKVSLAALVRGAIVEASPVAKARGIRIAHSASPSVEVTCDPRRLRQVVDTLLAASIKLEREGGLVTVGVERNRTAIEIAITHARSTVVTEALGIGFDIARRIVQMHAGTLTLNDTGFAISLPPFSTSNSRRVSRDRAHRLFDKNRQRTRARGRI